MLGRSSFGSGVEGGRFDFDDGGSYVGEWGDGRAHGLGLATGPENQGEYSGEWVLGFESCGVYIWPSGNVYQGSWLKGKRHGEGVQVKGRWIYKGAFTTGFCGRYGMKESLSTQAKYEGSWHLNLFDGFGIETNSDGSTYAGAWSKGVRQGLGVRKSVPYGLAADYHDKSLRPSQSQTSMGSLNDTDQKMFRDRDRRLDEVRSGFVLRNKSSASVSGEKKGLFNKKPNIKFVFFRKMKKPRSMGDINNPSVRAGRQGGSMRSNDSAQSHMTNHSMPPGVHGDHCGAGIPQDGEAIINPNVTEVYCGQWNEDKRSGHGVAERSDGLSYVGEWFNNKRDGYGVTQYPDGSKEEGRYKNNILVTALNKRNKLLMLRHSRLKECVEDAVKKAQEAAKDSQEKAVETAIQRAQTARSTGQAAEVKAAEALERSNKARLVARELATDFYQPGLDWERNRDNQQQQLKDPNAPGGPNHSRDPQGNSNSNPSDSLRPEVLEVSGSRRGSFRSSFRRHRSNTNLADSGHQDNHNPSRGRSGGVSQTPVEETIKMQTASTVHADAPMRRNPHARGQSQMQEVTITNVNQAVARGVPQIQHLQNNRQQQSRPLPSTSSLGGPSQQPQQQQKLSEITASTQVVDHYDQYCHTLPRTKRDSGLGRDSSLEESTTTGTTNGISRWDSGTPDSGMSELSHTSRGSRTRRRTLPSIMSAPPITAGSISMGCHPPDGRGNSPSLSEKVGQNLFIIENGVRKRVQTEPQSTHFSFNKLSRRASGQDDTSLAPTSLVYEPEQEDLAPLPRSYRIESTLALRKDLGEGSLPDVSVCHQMQRQTLMTREEVTKLSQARRQELLRETERRRRGEIIIRLADVKPSNSCLALLCECSTCCINNVDFPEYPPYKSGTASNSSNSSGGTSNSTFTPTTSSDNSRLIRARRNFALSRHQPLQCSCIPLSHSPPHSDNSYTYYSPEPSISIKTSYGAKVSTPIGAFSLFFLILQAACEFRMKQMRFNTFSRACIVVKDWIKKNIVLVLILLLNTGLALFFFSLLTTEKVKES